MRERVLCRGGGAALVALGGAVMGAAMLARVPAYEKIGWGNGLGLAAAGGVLIALGSGVLAGRPRLLHWVESLVGAVVGLLLVKAVLVQTFYIPSQSMWPNLLTGDYLLASRVSYGLWVPYTEGTRVFRLSHPKRGDVVIFTYPLDNDTNLIKRVLAVPGERVEMRGGRVYANGAEVPDPWGRTDGKVALPDEVALRNDFGPVVVPPGQYFVLGDNRNASYDSRYWGFVDEGRIKAKALFLYWSWDASRWRPRWGRVGARVT